LSRKERLPFAPADPSTWPAACTLIRGRVGAFPLPPNRSFPPVGRTRRISFPSLRPSVDGDPGQIWKFAGSLTPRRRPPSRQGHGRLLPPRLTYLPQSALTRLISQPVLYAWGSWLRRRTRCSFVPGHSYESPVDATPALFLSSCGSGPTGRFSLIFFALPRRVSPPRRHWSAGFIVMMLAAPPRVFAFPIPFHGMLWFAVRSPPPFRSISPAEHHLVLTSGFQRMSNPLFRPAIIVNFLKPVVVSWVPPSPQSLMYRSIRVGIFPTPQACSYLSPQGYFLQLFSTCDESSFGTFLSALLTRPFFDFSFFAVPHFEDGVGGRYTSIGLSRSSLWFRPLGKSLLAPGRPFSHVPLSRTVGPSILYLLALSLISIFSSP